MDSMELKLAAGTKRIKIYARELISTKSFQSSQMPRNDTRRNIPIGLKRIMEFSFGDEINQTQYRYIKTFHNKVLTGIVNMAGEEVHMIAYFDFLLIIKNIENISYISFSRITSL